eukprot:2872672-Rhodomonas_salina.1
MGVVRGYGRRGAQGQRTVRANSVPSELSTDLGLLAEDLHDLQPVSGTGLPYLWYWSTRFAGTGLPYLWYWTTGFSGSGLPETVPYLW